MNKRGQAIIFLLMIGSVIIILALAFANPLKQVTDDARNTTSGDTLGLNCVNTTDTFVEAACISTDIAMPYFIGFMIAIAGAVIGAKIFFG